MVKTVQTTQDDRLVGEEGPKNMQRAPYLRLLGVIREVGIVGRSLWNV